MFKILIITMVILFTSCTVVDSADYYDTPYIVTSIEKSVNPNFLYWYSLTGKNNVLRFHTNKKWHIGDSIYIGAKWGRENAE